MATPRGAPSKPLLSANENPAFHIELGTTNDVIAPIITVPFDLYEKEFYNQSRQNYKAELTIIQRTFELCGFNSRKGIRR